MDLREIRKTYVEILLAWNNVFPPFPELEKRDEEVLPHSFDIDEESSLKTMAKLRKAHHELKKEADASGNAKIWTAEEYSQEFLKSLIPQR